MEGRASAASALEEAVAEVRAADGKQRLAFVQTRAAFVDLDQGDPEQARARAEIALEAASVTRRPSDVALARVALARASARIGDLPVLSAQLAALAGVRGLSRRAADAVAELLSTEVSSAGVEPGGVMP
jgi:hypothetical protein